MLHLTISMHHAFMFSQFCELLNRFVFLPETKYFSSADSSSIPRRTQSLAACRNVSRSRRKIRSQASRSAFLSASFSCEGTRDKHEYNYITILSILDHLWCIHTGRNRDWVKDRKQMGYTLLCGSFHITPKPGQGLRSTVQHCSDPGSCSCLGPGSAQYKYIITPLRIHHSNDTHNS